ncbi:MAG: YlbF family regulator [Clostridia bacterium]|nr:YlbF family regulator [Clostridia bacterium]
MNVFEITRQLGKAIQQDETYIKYNLAKEANDQDAELQNLIGEFNLLRIALNNEMTKEEKDDAKMKEINDKIRECYTTIMQNSNMIAYNQANAELDAMMKKVNGILDLCLQGEDPDTCEPSECTGSCSTCGGCH